MPKKLRKLVPICMLSGSVLLATIMTIIPPAKQPPGSTGVEKNDPVKAVQASPSAPTTNTFQIATKGKTVQSPIALADKR
jgi:hypothetical protein